MIVVIRLKGDADDRDHYYADRRYLQAWAGERRP
jgi:hypothetical protein